MINLAMLCFECPRCHAFPVGIDWVQDRIAITCRECRGVFLSWFNGEMWLSSVTEELFDLDDEDEARRSVAK